LEGIIKFRGLIQKKGDLIYARLGYNIIAIKENLLAMHH
jgi:hypothetical protein